MDSPPIFADFFQEATGYRPFRWQEELANRVLEEGRWPPFIDLPTGAGKTKVIEIALWWIANTAARRPPRRIFYVVDRRLVVDSAYDEGLKLAAKLRHALSGGPPALRWTAERLCQLAGEAENPLQVVRLRGGGFIEKQWITSPLQPTLVVTTVDQIGSRLLFRGYGYGRDSTNPLSVHAALACSDALIFVDEAHLSDAFINTLQAVEEMRTQCQEPSLLGFWQVVELTATPRPDRQPAQWPTEDIQKRLAAPKPLVEVRPVPEDELPKKMAEQAVRFIAQGNHPVTAAVCNRVLRARQTFEEARGRCEELGCDVILLTGRIRPLDKDRILKDHLGRMLAGRSRETPQRPLLVVATQTIEVGADLDFDAMVVELPSLDALVQRLGRLNRLGTVPQAPVAIFANQAALRAKNSDPVYGQSLRPTWDLLQERKPQDLSWEGLRQILGQVRPDELSQMLSPIRQSPELLPTHLDMLAETSPIPQPEPDIAQLLHGFDAAPPEVSIVWRADLDPDHPENWKEIAELMPPSELEAMELPIHVVRTWLSKLSLSPADDPGDVEGETALQEPQPAGQAGLPCLRWVGREATLEYNPSKIGPGETIIVPAKYGSCDEFGWNPSSTAPVKDLAEAAQVAANSLDRIRLHPALLEQWLYPHDPDRAKALLSDLTDALQAGDVEAAKAAEHGLLALIKDCALDQDLRIASGRLLSVARKPPTPYPDGSGVLATERKPKARTDPEDTSTSVGRPVPLEEHSCGVAHGAKETAQKLGLPKAIVDDLFLAGLLHDVGKAHPNFQAWLYGVEPGPGLPPQLLAKSARDPRDRKANQQARELASLPSHWRHEALSTALAEAWSGLRQHANDPDLVLHLLASHHGAGRPFFPAPDRPLSGKACLSIGSCPDGEDNPPALPASILLEGEAPPMWNLNMSTADRFWRLVRKYGWWGLAFLEMILRMADWRQSELEQAGTSSRRRAPAQPNGQSQDLSTP